MRFLQGLLVAIFSIAANVCLAQTYPAGTVHIVVPYSAGGGIDALARALAERLSAEWGRVVVVENKPGANTMIGAQYVAAAKPDGLTLLLTESSTLVINPNIYQKLPYDTFRDFAPVTELVSVTQVLVAPSSFPASTVGEVIRMAKAEPGKLNYATFGVGSTAHLNMELFASAAGIKLTHIPYKGSAPAMIDLSAGRVELMFSSVGGALAQWKGGRIKMIAFGSSKRLPKYPDIPTVAEAGLKGFEASAWFGVVAPAGTPAEAINKIQSTLHKITSDPAFRAKYLDPQAFEPVVSTPAEFGAFLKEETVKWGEVAREKNIRVN
ncbi:MAG: tripartite tricarboxylate transporter substrate binding protein [Rhizobiales bacterium]|nr:tripartite tricarboxylate transporter substrate binding protein [Hyphomicrobiales bacterium]